MDLCRARGGCEGDAGGLMQPSRSTSRPCERRDPSVSAIALIAAARTLVSALEQKPFFTFEARGDGSLRSQGRPAERSCEETGATYFSRKRPETMRGRCATGQL